MPTISFTYTVTNSAGGAALEGVNVWVTSDIGGQTVLDSDQTNASGQVTITVDSAVTEGYFWHSLSGYNADANPNLTTITSGGSGSGTMTAIVSPVPDPVVLSTTARDIISDALMECGILAQGEEAEAEDADTGLKRLNRLLESWHTQRNMAYQVKIARHTLTANQTSHTIGPSGDFVTDRPVRIVRANIVPTGSAPTHYPVRIIERAEEWAEISVPLTATNIPSNLYCDYGWPNATLYLWPYPNIAYDLELFTWQLLALFTTLDSPVNLPPGYYDALMYSLAERLCTPFGVPRDTRAQISEDARKARAKVQSLNVRSPKISVLGQGIPNTEGL